MSLSFVQKIESASGQEIFLVKGFDFAGRQCWYYVKVAKPKAEHFSALIARGDLINLEDHGDIVLSGYGAAPSDDDMRKLRQGV
jgi:hypothetical protein